MIRFFINFFKFSFFSYFFFFSISLVSSSFSVASELPLTGIQEEVLEKQEQQISEKDKPTKSAKAAEISADNIAYDKDSGSLIASGGVLLEYNGRRVSAEEVEYNSKSRQIYAETGVEFVAENGDKFTAEKLLTDDKFSSGKFEDVKVVMKDGSSFQSEDLSLLSKDKYVLKNSIYTPCKPCEGQKNLWDLKARKIIYSEEDERIYYRDATVEVMDVPIFYTPYISHPTPFAKSKTGFLTPSFGRSSDYGVFLTTPYYYQFAPNMDYTFTPTITTQDGPLIINEFRHLVEEGSYEFLFSGIYPKERDDLGNLSATGDSKFRGHIEGNANFHFADYWHADVDFKRATDDTFLERYDLGNEDVLTSEGGIARLKGRDNLSMKVVSFQGLRQNDDPGISPKITPVINFGKVYELDDSFDSKVGINFNHLNINRSEGNDTSRYIAESVFESSYLSSSGHKLDLEVSARADYYNVEHFTGSNGVLYNGEETRFIPQGSLTWKYPLYNSNIGNYFVIEPTVMLVVSRGDNFDFEIPNEDSQNRELYDYNLFQQNHISGYDLVESGFRSNYGFRGILDVSKYGRFDFLFGQSYKDKTERIFNNATGMDDNISDFVGRVIHNVTDDIYTNIRYRLDKDDLSMKRSEVGFEMDVDWSQFTLDYTFIDGIAGAIDRQEVYSKGKVPLSDDWSLLAEGRRNLDNDNNSGWVSLSGGVEYTNDCLTTAVELKKEFTRDRDVEPSTSVLFNVTLKNLGS